jgi:hypothetical protein
MKGLKSGLADVGKKIKKGVGDTIHEHHIDTGKVSVL